MRFTLLTACWQRRFDKQSLRNSESLKKGIFDTDQALLEIGGCKG